MISFKTSSKNWGLCKRSLQRQEKTMEDPARQEMWRDLWRRSVASQCTVSPPPAGRKWQTKYNSNQSVWRVQRRKNIPKNNDRWNHRVEYEATTHMCWLLWRWLLPQTVCQVEDEEVEENQALGPRVPDVEEAQERRFTKGQSLLRKERKDP